jgi:hypothetical protein
MPQVEGDGMKLVKKIHNCGEKPNQVIGHYRLAGGTLPTL